jgi:hypothetical protein
MPDLALRSAECDEQREEMRVVPVIAAGLGHQAAMIGQVVGPPVARAASIQSAKCETHSGSGASAAWR